MKMELRGAAKTATRLHRTSLLALLFTSLPTSMPCQKRSEEEDDEEDGLNAAHGSEKSVKRKQNKVSEEEGGLPIDLKSEGKAEDGDGDQVDGDAIEPTRSPFGPPFTFLAAPMDGRDLAESTAIRAIRQ